MKTIILCLMFTCVGCASQAATWDSLLQHQTISYINNEGKQAYNIRCVDPVVCYRLASMVCPRGYLKSGETTTYKHNMSCGGGVGDVSETRFDVVCK